MILPDEAVKEFVELYKKNYGVELNPADGRTKAEKLYRFLKLITKPPTTFAKKDLPIE